MAYDPVTQTPACVSAPLGTKDPTVIMVSRYKITVGLHNISIVGKYSRSLIRMDCLDYFRFNIICVTFR